MLIRRAIAFIACATLGAVAGFECTLGYSFTHLTLVQQYAPTSCPTAKAFGCNATNTAFTTVHGAFPCDRAHHNIRKWFGVRLCGCAQLRLRSVSHRRFLWLVTHSADERWRDARRTLDVIVCPCAFPGLWPSITTTGPCYCRKHRWADSEVSGSSTAAHATALAATASRIPWLRARAVRRLKIFWMI